MTRRTTTALLLLIALCGCSNWIQRHTPGHGPSPSDRHVYNTPYEDNPPGQ